MAWSECYKTVSMLPWNSPHALEHSINASVSLSSVRYVVAILAAVLSYYGTQSYNGVKLYLSRFETCFALNTWKVGSWGAKHISKHDCWRHFETPKSCDGVMYALLTARQRCKGLRSRSYKFWDLLCNWLRHPAKSCRNAFDSFVNFSMIAMISLKLTTYAMYDSSHDSLSSRIRSSTRLVAFQVAYRFSKSFKNAVCVWWRVMMSSKSTLNSITDGNGPEKRARGILGQYI